MVVGGGGRGKEVGIDRGTMILTGATINKLPLFIGGSPQAGGMTIGSVVGGEINGIMYQYLTIKCNRTGAPGKGAGIGRGIKAGVSKGCNNPECDHINIGREVKSSDRLNHSTNMGEVNNSDRLNHSTSSTNMGAVNNSDRLNHSINSTNRETRKVEKVEKEGREGMEKEGTRVTSRMIKGLT